MGYRHKQDDVLDAAVRLAGEVGLVGLTFRAVGRRLGIPDRTVVYYFPSKSALVAAVLHESTAQLMEVLASVVGDEERSFPQLLGLSWEALSRPEVDAALRLYVETAGLAARGHEPYHAVIMTMTSSWTSWFADRLVAGSADTQDQGVALVAALDGLLLVQTTAGSGHAAAAARALGVELTRPSR